MKPVELDDVKASMVLSQYNTDGDWDSMIGRLRADELMREWCAVRARSCGAASGGRHDSPPPIGGVVLKRKVRLTGGETAELRAERLARLSYAHVPASMKVKARAQAEQAFVDGYLAAVQDMVEAPP